MAIPNEEAAHLKRVEQLRAADAEEVASSLTPLTGREAVNNAITQMMAPIHQLSADPTVDRRLVEQFKSEARTLAQRSEGEEAHNALFVLAGEMRDLSRRANEVLSA